MTNQLDTRISPTQSPQDNGQLTKLKYQVKCVTGSATDTLVSPFVNPKSCLVISGFWRSGTTWLQQSISEVTRSKTVFEPFRPQIKAYQDQVLTYTAFPDDPEFGRAFMPCWAASEPAKTHLESYIYKSFKSTIWNPKIREVRTDPKQTLRTRSVVKFVRGQFCLEGISRTFKSPIIHIYRDPRAVIASIKRMHQGNIFRFLSRVSLEQLLLASRDPRRDYFGQWEDLIHDADNQDFVTKLATLWATTEHFVCKSMQSIRPGYRVQYEDLCFGETDPLVNFLADIGFPLKGEHSKDLMSPMASRMTTQARLNASINERVFSWKKDLTPAEIDSIHTVVSRLGLEASLLREKP